MGKLCNWCRKRNTSICGACKCCNCNSPDICSLCKKLVTERHFEKSDLAEKYQYVPSVKTTHGLTGLRPVTVFKNVRNELKQLEKVEMCKGLFHGFGCDYEEFESGPGNFTVALVEIKDGSVITVHPEMIRFDDSTYWYRGER